MQQLTAEEIKGKIEQGESFVLDLFATWCGPCKVMLRNLEEVNESLIKESNNSPSYNIYKFDVDSDLSFSRELGVRSVPTIKIYKEVHVLLFLN
jgi:thioredoxin-like negative regulator of GroEL